MRTPAEALRELRSRLECFCGRTDGKYDPPWAQELIDIIDDASAPDAVADNAAIRRALEELMASIETRISTSGLNVLADAKAFLDAKAALAKPPRQCDIGTADEQAERFKKFCFDHQAPWHGCTNCPTLMSEKCALTRAQMPYRKEGAE